ncbi:MAG: helix-hairpin-helix domain-containing protein, partial [Deltaproteobacteria bacterium]|nr:helix-hairpin-helix domain-containing protein [Deltaproteobacteria bacterium]
MTNEHAGFGLWAAAALAMIILSLPLTARADDYGTFVDVDTEEELLDLLATDEIDQTAFDVLVELLHDGVDLNSADREALYTLPNLTYADVDAILDYRKDTGAIRDPLDLVSAGVLSRRKLMAIAAFIVIREPERGLWDTSGRIQYRTSYVGGDDEAPSMWLGAHVSTLRDLRVGLIGVLTRTRLSDVVYDPTRDALSAKAPSVQFQVPKYFVEWETDQWHVIGGTYRIGFGQSLTFDNTGSATPNGIRVDDAIYYSQDLSLKCRESAGELDLSPCRGLAGNEYRSPDYRWTDRLRGLAVGLKSGKVGDGWFQAYAFGSFQTKGIYQYEIYDRDRCKDPTDDSNPNCKAPMVFRRLADPRDAAPRFSYQTLPNMFNELTAGGNVAYFFNRRTHVGITGYGADVYWLVDGMDLDFQEWSRLPYGGPFGAVGINASWGTGIVDLFAEVTRSFDSQPDGGGWAGILRATLAWPDHELETSVRYYHRNFVN